VAKTPSGRKRDAHGWNTTDADEIDKRRERGRKEQFSIENLTPERTVFSNFAVHSPSGQSYEVEIRDLAWREVFCTCVDFRVNRLGTCKHVEAVLDHLEKEEPEAFEAAIENGSDLIDVVPSPDGRSLAVARNFDALPPRARGWFDSEGAALMEAAERTLRELEKLKPGALRISREVREWQARRAREADLFAARREYEQAVQAGRAPLSETALPLAPYQREGMLHLAFRERAIVADEVGLNRSAQAVAACALLERLGRASRVLVIAPYALRPSWEKEIAQRTSLSHRALPRSSAARREVYERPSFFSLATYEQASEDVESINEILAPDVVILDEAQRIRDWDAPVALRVKQLQSRYAFVLTSDEIGTDLDEVYALMSFVDPAVLGPLFRFNRDYYEFDEEGRPVTARNLDRLHEKMRPFVLRRTRAAVASQLPPLSQSVYAVDLSSRQREAYQTFERSARELQAEERKRKLTKPEREKLMRSLGMMRMVCDSVAVIGEQDRSEPPKLGEFRRILAELIAGQSTKTVVYTEWERMGRLLTKVCETLSIPCVFLHGELTAAERRRQASRFAEDPECQIAISTDVSASPLSSAGVRTLVHFDVPWNPRRIEERRRVFENSGTGSRQELFLISRDSVEERLLSRHQRLRPERAKKRAAADSPPPEDLIPESESSPPRQLSEAECKAIERCLAQARKRLRVAQTMSEEGFEAEACAQLQLVFLEIAKARAVEFGLEPPETAEALVEPPFSEALGADALGLWKWFHQPVAGPGLAIATRCLE